MGWALKEGGFSADKPSLILSVTGTGTNSVHKKGFKLAEIPKKFMKKPAEEICGFVLNGLIRRVFYFPRTLSIVSRRTDADFCNADFSLGHISISMCWTAPRRPTIVGTEIATSCKP